MGKRPGIVILALVLLLAGCGQTNADIPTAAQSEETREMLPTEETIAMRIESTGIINGVIDPKYGANGDIKTSGVPVLSLPLLITGAPEGTTAFAIYMEDPDAKPISGYNWVHWMAANIKTADIPEDFSRKAGEKAVQGKNDFDMTGYGGPMPPDKDHTYVITAYALSAPLKLKDGFSKEDFAKAIQDQVLAEASVKGLYKK